MTTLTECEQKGSHVRWERRGSCWRCAECLQETHDRHASDRMMMRYKREMDAEDNQ